MLTSRAKVCSPYACGCRYLAGSTGLFYAAIAEGSSYAASAIGTFPGLAWGLLFFGWKLVAVASRMRTEGPEGRKQR